MNFRACVLISGVALIAALLVGCGGKKADEPAGAPETISNAVAETIIEHAAKEDGQDVEVEIKGAGDSMSISVTGKDGEQTISTGAQTQPPQEMPADIPVFPGLNLTFTHAMPEQILHSYVGETTWPIADVAAYYQKEAASMGWTQQNAARVTDVGEHMEVFLYHKDNRMMEVIIINEDGKITVTVNSAKR